MTTSNEAATCGQCKDWRETTKCPGMGYCSHPDAAVTITASRVSVACYLLPKRSPCKLKH